MVRASTSRLSNALTSKYNGITPRQRARRCSVSEFRLNANMGKPELSRDISIAVLPVSVCEAIPATPGK